MIVIFTNHKSHGHQVEIYKIVCKTKIYRFTNTVMLKHLNGLHCEFDITDYEEYCKTYYFYTLILRHKILGEKFV